MFGPVLGGLGGMFGGGFSSRSERYRTDRARINRAYKGLFMPELLRDFAAAEGQYRSMLDTITKGYEAGKAQASRLGEASRRQTLDREQQGMGEVSAGLAQSGLWNTSTKANLQRGVQAQTSRELQDIDQMLAGVFSDLEVGKGLAQAQVQGGLAGLFERKAGARQMLNQNWMAQLYGGGGQAMRGPSPWEDIMGLVGTAGGAFLGGGFGKG